jgi:hypothetical protein
VDGEAGRREREMDLATRLTAVRSDRVEFVTMRPPGSPLAILDRRVVVTGPPEVVELSRSGDPRLLDALVDLLGDRDRAWAAQVLLAALTRHEEKLAAERGGLTRRLRVTTAPASSGPRLPATGRRPRRSDVAARGTPRQWSGALPQPQ